MIQVVKRDGEVAEFSLNKITEAIKKAFRATSKDYNNEILELLSLRVTADFQNKMKDGRISVEEIQDSVEHVLEQTGYTDVAKAYILYYPRYCVLLTVLITLFSKSLQNLIPAWFFGQGAFYYISN